MRRAVTVAATVAALTLVACGSSTGDPYAGQIEQAKAGASTPFERAVLADGKITHAEYQDSLNRQVACLKAHGYSTVSLYDQLGTGIFALEYPTPSNQDSFDRIKNDCAQGTSRVVADLYVRMTTNPQDIDPNQLMVNCLHRLRLAPDSFTAENYRSYLKSHGPIPFDIDDVRFSECSVDPAKSW